METKETMGSTPGLARRTRASGRYSVVVGVHNALGAAMAERSGFDGIWVSSLEVSSSKRLPDANLVNLTEMAQLIREIRAAVRLPVIVDSDNGYGSDELAVRAALEYVAAGADAVCVEDNAFPKRCSFYRDAERTLEEGEDFARRLSVMKQAIDGRAELIARTEGLVAGLGVAATVARVRQYVAAGADALFIQTTSHDLAAYADVLRQVRHLAPILFTPTALPEATAPELHHLGVDVVIFANVVVRTIVRATESTLGVLRQRESLASVQDSIASLETLFDVTGATAPKVALPSAV
jgi:phosphoenolpyruvate phosphomutase